jgi:hypothetical protein
VRVFVQFVAGQRTRDKYEVVLSRVNPMSSRVSCVSDAVQALIELRAALSDGTNAVQVERVDEVIRLLQASETQHGFDTGKLADAMRILGEGIALIPAVMDLLRKLDP